MVAKNVVPFRAPVRARPRTMQRKFYGKRNSAGQKGPLNGFGRLGSVAYAEQGASIGATAGSAAGPIGTVIGTIAGAVIGLFAHQGQGPQRAAAAQAIDGALAQIPSTAGIGVQIPWIGSSNAPGLQQYLQALMTSGLFMSFDTSLSRPSVNGNWANTFIAALKQVVQAIIANPTGATVSVNITDRPGGNDAVAGTFNFVNPGLQVGPDAISARIIMGNGGMVYWMILRTGESTSHAMQTANSSAAQKVFALMVDHAAHDFAPQLFAPPVAAATISTVANAPVATIQPVTQGVAAQSVATIQPVTGPNPVVTGTTNYTGTTTPVVAPDDTDALIAAMQAQGASQNQSMLAAIASLEANGINTQQPQVQQQLAQSVVAPSVGISSGTLLLLGGGILAAVLLLK